MRPILPFLSASHERVRRGEMRTLRARDERPCGEYCPVVAVWSPETRDHQLPTPDNALRTVADTVAYFLFWLCLWQVLANQCSSRLASPDPIPKMLCHSRALCWPTGCAADKR